MDHRRGLFFVTLAFSLFLEVWVRWVMPLTHGDSGFGIWPPVDNVMHFFWGLNIFVFLVLYLRFTPVDALLGVYAWQMAWELMEMVGDIMLRQPGYMLDHFFFDGIKDTLVDLAGGALGWLLLSRSKGAKHSEEVGRMRERRVFRRLAIAHLWLMLPVLPIGTYLRLSTGESPDLLGIVWIAGAALVAAAGVGFRARPATDGSLAQSVSSAQRRSERVGSPERD